jgi:hypothetical protein
MNYYNLYWLGIKDLKCPCITGLVADVRWGSTFGQLGFTWADAIQFKGYGHRILY